MPFSKPFRFTVSFIAVACLASLFHGCASREERIQRIQAKADTALFEDRADEAIQILRRGLDKYADSEEIRIALSRTLQNTGQKEEAVELLETAVEQDPDNDQLWVEIAELRAQLGQHEEAINAFETYLKNHGSDFLAWKALALEYEASGKITPAIKAALKWNELTPSSQPALKLGELYLASSNIPQARSWFGQAAAYGDKYAAKGALAELIKLETSLQQFQQAANRLREYRSRYGPEDRDPRVQESATVLEEWTRAREEIAQAAAEIERERRELEEKRRTRDEQASAEAEESEAPAQAADSRDQSVAAMTADTGGRARSSPSRGERPPEALFGDNNAPADLPEQSAEAEESEAPQNQEASRLEEAIGAIEEQDYSHAISLLWDLLGEDDGDAELWYRLSQAYFQRQDWYDAEATILEAKRRAPRSEAIADQYLRTIAKTQNMMRVVDEIKAFKGLFPRSSAIALTLAHTLRDAKAAPSLIAAAYRDYLAVADRRDPGYQEANQYLQRRD